MFVKKIVIVSLAACLLLAASVAVTASETDWYLLMRAQTPNNTNYGLVLQAGTWHGAQDGYDATDVPLMDPTPGSPWASVASYQPTFPQYSLYTNDRRAPMTGVETKTWDIRLFVNSGYPDVPLRLVWFTSPVYSVPTSINGVPYRYWLHVYDDPTGEHQDEIIYFNDGIIPYGTYTDPAGYLDWTTYPKLAPGADPSAAIKLRFVAAPVPEPGSLFVLISGLASTTALAFRRRR